LGGNSGQSYAMLTSDCTDRHIDKDTPGFRSLGHATGAYDFNAEEEWFPSY